MSTDTEAILTGVRTWAESNDVPVDSVEDSEIVVTLPGEKKLKTNVAISVFARTAHLQAFVIRHPDENTAEFNRWLLQKNLKPGPVAFAIDSLGDVYLRASVPREHLLAELDGLLGAMLQAADSSFNELLLIGFLTGMKREWAWRVSRGESTRNLAAFEKELSGDDNEFLGTFTEGEKVGEGSPPLSQDGV
ncbi:YbjN domain-containing protein [Brevibacterium oceani]|uniref:YbjN domain-containing protein n=1 Tax=Brevibacterium oceani TaxID=358099 RepID=UPI001B320639|nr:YbjN domain-containing protein [Brevibacterium oceani]